MKLWSIAAFLGVVLFSTSLSATNYSMGCVERYSDAGFPPGANVSLTCDATERFLGVVWIVRNTQATILLA
jgi:hypothetical protein